MELTRIVKDSHPLVRLAKTLDWERLEVLFDKTYSEDIGRPAISIRLMVGLEYLKYTFDLSDENTVAQWLENPYWHYFCGGRFFEYELPIHPSSMTRFRKRMGEAGAEQLLKETIQAGLKLKGLKPSQLKRVNVDTTVQEKNIRFPTDARLYERARERLVKEAKKEGIALRQNYNRKAKALLLRSNRYAHAKQMKRASRCKKQLRTILGRVIRDIQRKHKNPSPQLQELLQTAQRIYEQQRNDKNKIYSVHETDVACISKGKAHKRYEFGCKVSLAVTSKGGWFVGALAFKGAPYDGHTLSKTLKQVERLAQLPEHVFVDRGYRKHDYKGSCTIYIDKPRRGKTPKRLWKWMKRRAAIEPSIGHLKAEHRMDRCRLKGIQGDHINAVLSAAGMNMKKLLKVALCLKTLTTSQRISFSHLYQKIFRIHLITKILHFNQKPLCLY